MPPVNDQLLHLTSLSKIKLDGLRFRLLDANGLVLGRVASHIAHTLQGKDKPIYNPGTDCGDVVVVINAAKVAISGTGWKDKQYIWHTGYPGGQRKISAVEMWKRDPCKLLSWAVYGMLPRNSARKHRMLKLRIFPDARHPFNDFPLLPLELPYRKLKDYNFGWLMPQGFSPMNPRMFAHRTMLSQLKWVEERPVLDFSDLLYESERQQLRLTGPSPTLELSAAVAGAAPAAAAAVASAAPKKLTWREKAQQEQEAKAARAAQQGSSAAPGRR